MALASMQRDTRTTLNGGMFLLFLLQWALLLEWRCLRRGLNAWQGGH